MLDVLYRYAIPYGYYDGLPPWKDKTLLLINTNSEASLINSSNSRGEVSDKKRYSINDA